MEPMFNIDGNLKERAESATVRLEIGQGVLVPGGMILTAAHCVYWPNDPANFTEEIQTHDGQTLVVRAVAVEPVADIAALSSEDKDFKEFCNQTKPVPVSTQDFDDIMEFPVWVWSFKEQWIEAEARQNDHPEPFLWLTSSAKIEFGTSGAPIIDPAGQLVAVVSHSSDECEWNGRGPRPHLTLPAWILNKIESPEDSRGGELGEMFPR